MPPSTKINKVSLFFIFLSAAYCLFWFYLDLAGQWTVLSRGINTFNSKIFLFELPLAVVLAGFFYFSSIRQKTVRFILPVISIVICYRLVELFYDTFKRSPTISDFENVFAIGEFSFAEQIILLLLLLLIFAPFIVAVWQAYKNKLTKNNHLLENPFVVRILVSIAFLLLFNGGFLYKLQSYQFNYIPWSDENNLRQNGRLSSFFYLSYLEKLNRQKLLALSENHDIQYQSSYFEGDASIKPNIHLVVLESFIDPRLIKQLTDEDYLLANELRQLLNSIPLREYRTNTIKANGIRNGVFSHVLSPIYGGGTAQAEFELLTGLPALARFNKIEFNVMRGGEIDSFANKLAGQGYQLHSTIAPTSRFFNSKRAYRSLGFDSPVYLEEEATYQIRKDKQPIFDGELFNRNLNDLKVWRANSKKPIFNYVLGMYGHYPFARDKKMRPDIFSPVNETEKIQNISNQFYYRTRALAQYLKQLKSTDPNSVVLIISDHLPAVIDGEHPYQLDTKVNIALYLEGESRADISGYHYFQLPHLIWQHLSGTGTIPAMDEAKNEQMYYRIMAQSIKTP